MKPPNDPPPPRASTGHPEKSSAGQAPSAPRDGARHYRSRYEDGVVHHPHLDAHGHDDMHNEDVAHEHGDINVRAIAWAVAILMVVGVFAQVAMYLLFGVFERQAKANDPPVSAVAAPPTQMPGRTTEAPSCANRRTVARPIPLALPVTSATLPAKSLSGGASFSL